MRIVDRKTFLEQLPGTVFQKYIPCSVEEICIKGETLWHEGTKSLGDFWYQPIGVCPTNAPPSMEDSEYRDGCFDPDQLFALYDDDDVHTLIAQLREAVAKPKILEQP